LELGTTQEVIKLEWRGYQMIEKVFRKLYHLDTIVASDRQTYG